MEHKALSALIIRIAGLLVLVYSIANAAGYLVPYLYPRSTGEFEIRPLVLSLFVTMVLPLFLGLLLICFPHSITNHVLKVEGTAVGTDGVKPLQRVVFSAIGLWLTLYAVIDATYFYARSRLYLEYYEDQPSYSGDSPLMPDDFGGLVSSAVHLYQLDVAAKARNIGIALVIFDPQYLPRLFATRRGPYLQEHLKFMKDRPWVRHDEHYHVDFAISCSALAG